MASAIVPAQASRKATAAAMRYDRGSVAASARRAFEAVVVTRAPRLRGESRCGRAPAGGLPCRGGSRALPAADRGTRAAGRAVPSGSVHEPAYRGARAHAAWVLVARALSDRA